MEFNPTMDSLGGSLPLKEKQAEEKLKVRALLGKECQDSGIGGRDLGVGSFRKPRIGVRGSLLLSSVFLFSLYSMFLCL